MSDKTVVISPEYLSNIFGSFDENVKALEKTLGVQILDRGDDVKVTGEEPALSRACEVLQSMQSVAASGETVSVQHVNYLCSLSETESKEDFKELMNDVVAFTKAGKPIRPKTFGQKQYVKSIRDRMLTFGIGPAGTGKTYLAMAMAVTAFKKGEISRIILTRPAIEAGERLGFLPGDLQSKVDPYLRPLYDALFEIMGQEAFQRNLEKGAIEVAPLAYMRGRTLDNSFIVLDEAQNTTQAQMKMFLTRIGFGSKAVITGDLTQIDLPKDQKSGLTQAVAFLKNIEEIGIVKLSNKDVVRHPLVQKIVEAYEKNEKAIETAKAEIDREYKAERRRS